MKKIQLLLIGLFASVSCASWAEDAAANAEAANTAEVASAAESATATEVTSASEISETTEIAQVIEGSVARSAFTSAVDNREPVDQIGQLSNDNGQIYFFTELKDLEGRTIIHRWEKDGEIQAEVSFNVGGNRWRVWSSKTLQPEWLGNWQVSVVDDAGNVISQESFAYIPSAEPAETAEATTAEPADNAAVAPAVNEADLSNISPAAGGTANEATTATEEKTAE